MNIPIQKIKGKRILVIGDLMLDIYLRGKAKRISPEAPVPIVSAECRELIPGGAANVMSNLSALGCDVYGAGFVGNDDEGNSLLKKINYHGIRTDSIIVTNLSTIHKTRVLANGHHVVRFDFDTNFSKVKEKNRLLLIGCIQSLMNLKHFDAIIISDYNKGTIDQNLMNIIKQDFSGPILVDAKPQNKTLFENVYCIAPNLEEAKQMVGNFKGDDDPFPIARLLKEKMCLKSIIITLADQGILLIDENNKEILHQAYVNDHDPTQRFDVTGAGDTVISVFSACISAGILAHDAILVANIAAGIVVSKIGTALCSYKELVNELNIFLKRNNENRGST